MKPKNGSVQRVQMLDPTARHKVIRTLSMERLMQGIAKGVRMDPLEFLSKVMHNDYDLRRQNGDEDLPMPMRVQAAQALAKFIHPTLKAIEVTEANGSTVQFEVVVNRMGVEGEVLEEGREFIQLNSPDSSDSPVTNIEDDSAFEDEMEDVEVLRVVPTMDAPVVPHDRSDGPQRTSPAPHAPAPASFKPFEVISGSKKSKNDEDDSPVKEPDPVA